MTNDNSTLTKIGKTATGFGRAISTPLLILKLIGILFIFIAGILLVRKKARYVYKEQGTITTAMNTEDQHVIVQASNACSNISINVSGTEYATANVGTNITFYSTVGDARCSKSGHINMDLNTRKLGIFLILLSLILALIHIGWYYFVQKSNIGAGMESFGILAALI